jgi:hypothetical protein
MTAHRVAARSGTMSEVQRLFDTALASGRETGYVRSMQIAVAFNHNDKFAFALRAVNQAREKGEPLPEGARRVYQRWCESLRHASDRAQLLPVLDTEDALGTLAWIQPATDLPAERRPIWHLCQATLLAHGGRRDAARQVVEGVLARLETGQRGGSYERWAREQLVALGDPQRPE